MGNCHEPFLGEGDAATGSLLPDRVGLEQGGHGSTSGREISVANRDITVHINYYQER